METAGDIQAQMEAMHALLKAEQEKSALAQREAELARQEVDRTHLGREVPRLWRKTNSHPLLLKLVGSNVCAADQRRQVIQKLLSG